MDKHRTRILLADSPLSSARPPASPVPRLFDQFASHVTRWAGSPLSFCIAALTVLVWAITGPLFHYSNGWQLVINTGTTIITFLMVFLIQQSQNKDSIAVHLKLNELLASHHRANNEMIGIEEASEEDLAQIAKLYEQLAQQARTRSLRAAAQNPGARAGEDAASMTGSALPAGRKIIRSDDPDFDQPIP